MIDWNVTERTGIAHVKRYVEEREMTAILLVDLSLSGRFGSTTQLKIDLATEISAVLAFSAIKNNDKIGLLIFQPTWPSRPQTTGSLGAFTSLRKSLMKWTSCSP